MNGSYWMVLFGCSNHHSLCSCYHSMTCLNSNFFQGKTAMWNWCIDTYILYFSVKLKSYLGFHHLKGVHKWNYQPSVCGGLSCKYVWDLKRLTKVNCHGRLSSFKLKKKILTLAVSIYSYPAMDLTSIWTKKAWQEIKKFYTYFISL